MCQWWRWPQTQSQRKRHVIIDTVLLDIDAQCKQGFKAKIRGTRAGTETERGFCKSFYHFVPLLMNDYDQNNIFAFVFTFNSCK